MAASREIAAEPMPRAVVRRSRSIRGGGSRVSALSLARPHPRRSSASACRAISRPCTVSDATRTVRNPRGRPPAAATPSGASPRRARRRFRTRSSRRPTSQDARHQREKRLGVQDLDNRLDRRGRLVRGLRVADDAAGEHAIPEGTSTRAPTTGSRGCRAGCRSGCRARAPAPRRERGAFYRGPPHTAAAGLRPTPRLGRLRGPLRPAPLPRRRAVRA